MRSKHARLDRFISSRIGINRRDIKSLLAQGRIIVDGRVARDAQQGIGEFTRVTVDDQILQAINPIYIMLNKPIGVVSATKDTQHKTVIDLLSHPNRQKLHIVGRLDFNSTGLLLLTNDGRWSRLLTTPQQKVCKRYRVTLEKPISQDTIKAFSQGIYFEFENITTQAATLDILSDRLAEVSLSEGRYHQIKRMFGRFQNPVLKLHRIAIGNLALPSSLRPGESRELTQDEVKNIF